MAFEKEEPQRAEAAPAEAPRRAVPGRVVVQRRLAVGASDDPLEVEADRAADRVMRLLRSTSATEPGAAPLDRGRPTRIRRHGSHGHHDDHDDAAGHGPEVGMAGGEISAGLSSRITGASGGAPLGGRTLERMERGFGVSFADVRVHAGSDLPRQVAADAFTSGTDLHFAPGLYDPSSSSGERLLAHELAHVVQQGGATARRTLDGGSATRIARHACHDGCGHDHGVRSTVGPESMLADELLHVMQQPSIARSTDATGTIRRHASWEHKMLGDVDPATLEVIAAGRDVAAEAKAAKGGWFTSATTPKTIMAEGTTTPITLPTVLHTIDQEIRRLKLFQSNPPGGKVADATADLEKRDADDRKLAIPDTVVGDARALAEKQVDDAKWGVRLVSLRLQDGTSFLVTYGEMNTLADFYGSADEIAQTPAGNFRSIVGGVREESIRKFMRLRNELTLDGDKPYDPDADEHRIAGAIGNKGTLVGAHGLKAPLTADQFGELKLMGKLRQYEGGVTMTDESRATIGGREETSYTAGLARNACHFAPHSWHAWATAHNKAIALAMEAWKCNQQIAQLEQQIAELRQRGHEGDEKAIEWNTRSLEALSDKAAEKLNAALVENGFGDHFLQDSYAAGHLINKTLIMQWFVLWLDSNWNKRNYTWQDDWRQVQQVAYGQDGVGGRDLYDPKTVGTKASNDPQSVENLGGDWTDRFAALGLQVPSVLNDPNTDEFRVFTWWQEQALDGKLLSADWKDLRNAKCPVQAEKPLQAALIKLIDAGVVYFAKYSEGDRRQGAANVGLENRLYAKSLSIKREYIPKEGQRVLFTAALIDARNGDMRKYQKMAKAVSLADYHKFLNHGYVQLASNVLHDHFCKNGLAVATARDDVPYVIYGDNAMLGKESAKMVKYSAGTSHMSRDSIYDLAATGTTANTTQAIAERFPAFVRPVGHSVSLSLAEWHQPNGPLQTFCNTTVFDKDVAALFSKSTAVASDALTGKVSKDAGVHSGEAF